MLIVPVQLEAVRREVFKMDLPGFWFLIAAVQLSEADVKWEMLTLPNQRVRYSITEDGAAWTCGRFLTLHQHPASSWIDRYYRTQMTEN